LLTIDSAQKHKNNNKVSLLFDRFHCHCMMMMMMMMGEDGWGCFGYRDCCLVVKGREIFEWEET